MGPDKVRNMFNEKFLAIKAGNTGGWKCRKYTIKNDDRTTPLRIYTPNDQKDLPIILYIHGGAWVAGNLDTHDNLARYLCREVQALVVSVGYLNRTGRKISVPLNSVTMLCFGLSNMLKNFNANPARLAVVGDSAGGNMAAVLCLYST